MIESNTTPPGTPPTTVLICEDEEPLRELIRLSLGDGHRFLESADGRDVLELVRDERPDVVLLDVMLPGVSGLDLLRALRADPALAATRVVAVSAWVHLEGEALAAGADCFLGKPFEPDDLRSCVQRMLSS
ncbi:MAG: response regulator [Thermoleophilia bacterium]|nr:response regulator [Thermoleophilia bacterium]